MKIRTIIRSIQNFWLHDFGHVKFFNIDRFAKFYLEFATPLKYILMVHVYLEYTWHGGRKK